MSVSVFTVSLPANKLDISESEVLRYAGCGTGDNCKVLCELAKSCIEEIKGEISCRAVYAPVTISVSGDTVSLTDILTADSRSLRTFINGSDAGAVFAATVGIGADRLISRYSELKPSRAVMMDAAATAAIEAWCDYLCGQFFMRPVHERFSPGYGDLSLECQKDIITALSAPVQIGLALTDSLLLTPTKSVTAIVRTRG